MSEPPGKPLTVGAAWRNAVIGVAFTVYGAVYLALGWPTSNVLWPLLFLLAGGLVLARVMARPTKSMTLGELIQAYFGSLGNSAERTIKARRFQNLGRAYFAVAVAMCIPTLLFGPDDARTHGFFTVAAMLVCVAVTLHLASTALWLSAKFAGSKSQ